MYERFVENLFRRDSKKWEERSAHGPETRTEAEMSSFSTEESELILYGQLRESRQSNWSVRLHVEWF